MANELTKRMRWRHWLLLALGAWVFASPWMVGENLPLAGTGMIWNFLIVGSVIFVVAALALQNVKVMHEWIGFAAGFWLLLSPWIFGYAENVPLVWNSLISGLAVVVVSIAALPVAGQLRGQSSRQRWRDRDKDRAA